MKGTRKEKRRKMEKEWERTTAWPRLKAEPKLGWPRDKTRKPWVQGGSGKSRQFSV